MFLNGGAVPGFLVCEECTVNEYIFWMLKRAIVGFPVRIPLETIHTIEAEWSPE